MAEPTIPPEPAKTEDSILATKEPEAKVPEKTLFKTAPTVEEAKAAAIKELETKTASDKAAADAAAVKAETEKTKTTEKVSKEPDKAPTTTQTDYTLDLPENSALTKEDVDATLKEAKAAGLPVEKAKELLQSKDLLAKTAQSRLAQKQEQDMKSLAQTWKDQIKNDPEIGGEKLQETAIKASRAFKAVFDSETQNFIDKMGFGNYPGLVKGMLKVHELIGEDRFIKGSTGVTQTSPTTMEEKAKKLFGNPIKETV